jgi:RNA polymerase sigma factor (sigma-70 family)
MSEEAPTLRRGPATERELVLRARVPGRDRDQLIEVFRPLIASVARIYRGTTSIDRDELMQEGVVGLLRALERYDPDQGTPFWGYATWWVRQAMQQLVSELARPMVLSDRALRQLARVKDARRAYAQVHGREPSSEELAAETGMRLEQIHSLLAAERQPRALDAAADPDGDGATLGDRLADPGSEQAYERVPGRVAAQQLPTLFAALSGRERSILRGRYGLDGREQSLRELGGHHGVSAERVRQIEGSALDKLRDAAQVAV